MLAPIPTWFLLVRVLQPCQSVVCPAECYHLIKKYVIVQLCFQRMTRNKRPCHLWINLAGTPKGMRSTFMNF